MSKRPSRATVRTSVAAPTLPGGLPLPGPSQTTVAKQLETINTLLNRIQISGEPLLTQQQVFDLTSLKLHSGQPLLALEDRYFVYEVVGLVQKIKFDSAYQFLTSQVWMTSKECLFAFPTLDKAKDKMRVDASILRNKSIAAKGLFTCRRCGSKETISAQTQTRSADEPMTIKVTCIQCGKTWVES